MATKKKTNIPTFPLTVYVQFGSFWKTDGIEFVTATQADLTADDWVGVYELVQSGKVKRGSTEIVANED